VTHPIRAAAPGQPGADARDRQRRPAPAGAPEGQPPAQRRRLLQAAAEGLLALDRRRDRPLDASRQAAFDSLPAEVLARVADALPAIDRARLGAVPNHHVAHSIEPQVLAARIELRLAANVVTVQQFIALIGRHATDAGSIRSLPPALQAPPLCALAQRIPALAPHEQLVASLHVQTFPYAGPPHALLNELRREMLITDGLLRREQALTEPGSAAHLAVLGGRHLGTVAAESRICGLAGLRNLRRAAMANAQIQVARERNVADVSRELGLELPRDQAHLSDFAGRVPGRAMVRRGMDPQNVIQQLGIFSAGGRMAVRAAAASVEVEQGQNVQVVAARHGLMASVERLERIAAVHAGMPAVEAGAGTVATVAARLGIQSDRALHDLEMFVVAGPAMRAVARGEPTDSIIGRMGLVDPVALARLVAIAARLQRHGFIDTPPPGMPPPADGRP
jgi:hypothetical protein